MNSERAGHVLMRELTGRQVHMRTLPCACGGEITADIHDPTPEVRKHNETLQHRQWWDRVECQREAWGEE